jgi:aerobic-type carbon monoxide dehydrogenase small subunit (CoxS/CutS family)
VATANTKILADLRGTREYRRRLLVVAVRRALTVAFDRASGRATYAPPRRPAPPPWPRHAPGPEVGDALTVTIDGTPRVLPIRPDDNLLDLLRREGVTSVKRGCGEGYCGACAILVDGRLLNACRLLAPQVEGCTITTAAGIGTVFHPHPIQRALVEEGAVQCGFCTPGWVVATKSLLDDIPNPTYEEICAAMDGNLCRCTGYVKPLAAIERAADSLRREA